MFREATEEDLAPRPARRAPAGRAGFLETVGAGFDAERIETDWHNLMQRRYHERYRQAWSAVTSAMGEDAALQALRDRGLRTERIQGRAGITGRPTHQAAILEMASALNQDLYGSFPATRQALMEEVNAEVRAEYEDAAATLAMAGAGAGLAEFLGRGAVAVSDEVSLLTIPFSAGTGSVARVMLTEAALGAAAEAAILPRMYDQQERVGTPEPDPVAQVAMGAVLGGALGGIGEGLSRALAYSRLRREIGRIPPDLSPAEAQAAVEAAVEALDAGQPVPPPDVAMPSVQREEGPQAPFAPRDEEDAAIIGDGAPEPQRIPTQDEIDEARRQIIQDVPEVGRNRPTLERLLRMGGIQWRRANPNTGESELTPIASELQGMGITQKQLLSFTRRDGMPELDNIVASDFADGGTPRLRTDDTGTYLDRDALLEAIAQEVGGTPAYRTIEAEDAAQRIADLEDSFAAIRREMDEVADAEGLPDMEFNGPFIAAPVEGEDALARSQEIERAVDDFADQMDTPPSSEVRYDAMEYLAATGGNVEDAITRARMDAIERDFDAGSQAPTPRGSEALPASAADAGAGRAERAAAADVGADQGIARVDGPGSERTAAGEQFVTPGVEPVSQRQRLEAQQNAPMRGGDAVANDGLFDLNARLQRDMFDDLTSPEATARLDADEAELREAVERGDFDISDDARAAIEGQPVDANWLLREIEADRAHLNAIETCRWGGARSDG